CRRRCARTRSAWRSCPCRGPPRTWWPPPIRSRSAPPSRRGWSRGLPSTSRRYHASDEALPAGGGGGSPHGQGGDGGRGQGERPPRERGGGDARPGVVRTQPQLGPVQVHAAAEEVGGAQRVALDRGGRGPLGAQVSDESLRLSVRPSCAAFPDGA